MTRFRLLLSAVALALMASACGGTSSGPAPIAEAGLAEPASELFGTFETIDNGQIDLATLKGQDVVLWFWAPW